MSNQATTVSPRGIGFAGLLTIVFITLKLCGVIAWSWWWVLSPLWLGVALVLGFVVLMFGGAVLAALIAVAFTKLRR